MHNLHIPLRNFGVGFLYDLFSHNAEDGKEIIFCEIDVGVGASRESALSCKAKLQRRIEDALR